MLAYETAPSLAVEFLEIERLDLRRQRAWRGWSKSSASTVK